jgi:putative ABC transport system permease protein
MMGTLYQDLRFGIRTLSKDLGFTLVVVFTLGLGIGANTAIFSVVDAVLIRPLPFKDPDRLVVVWESNLRKGWDRHPVEGDRFMEWAKQNRVFEGMAARNSFDMNLSGNGEAERIRVAVVTSNYFSIYGVQPVLGRTFFPAEDWQGSGRVVVLSQGLWERRFGADTNVLGRAITLEGESYTIVGVMPARFLSEEQAWIPRRLMTTRDYSVAHGLFVLARLKPDVTVAQAQADMANIARRLEEQSPDTNTGWGVTVRALRDEIVRDIRPALLMLWCAVVLVLLIACANVANLLLARTSVRQKEMAIRSALGASRLRLVQQLLVESLFVAVIGGALGCLLSVWGVGLLVSLAPSSMPRLLGIHVDGRVLLFTLAASLVTGTLFGLPSAAHASTPDLNRSLKESSATLGGSASAGKLRHLLVVCELALTVVVVTGAGLLTRSFLRLLNVNLGLNSTNVLTIRFQPLGRAYSSSERGGLYSQLLRRIEALPGVESAAMVSDLPLSGRGETFRFVIEGRMPALFAEHVTAEIRFVSANYFHVMGIPLKVGRSFVEQDTGPGPGVVIIDETMARRFWPGENPLGRRISYEWDKGRWLTIVGIVGDVKEFGLDAETRPEMCVPLSQEAPPWMSLALRTSSDPMSLLPAVQTQINAVFKGVPAFDVRTMEQRLADSLAGRRFSMVLLSLFAALALILAAVGIYGVISYAVAQRTHEIGVRMALGANRSSVLAMVIKNGLVLTVSGIALGLAGASALTRLLASLLYDVKPTDPVTFGGVALLLVGVALLACYLPARRATKVDPMEALRYE